MTIPLWTLLALPLASCGLVAAGLPLMKRLALGYGIVSAPYSETPRQRQVPLLGGVAIIAAIMIPLLALNALPLWMGLPALALLLVGIVDDAAAMRPLPKFLLQAIVVAIVVIASPRFVLTPWRLLNVILAGFFLLSTVNAFNLVDGLDGLAGGIGVAAAIAAGGGPAGGGRRPSRPFMATSRRSCSASRSPERSPVFSSTIFIRRPSSWVIVAPCPSACCLGSWRCALAA